MSDPSASRSQSISAHSGIDSGRVSAWFEQNIPGVAWPLQFRRVAGGWSNLTFEVRDAASVGYVLRRPPVSLVLPTAHDMQRGYRIMAALGPAGVPVPPAPGLCLDEAVNGAPFDVMAFVDGIVARSEKEARESLNSAGRRQAGLPVINTLAQIHAVNPDHIRLGDLSRKDGYISCAAGTRAIRRRATRAAGRRTRMSTGPTTCWPRTFPSRATQPSCMVATAWTTALSGGRARCWRYWRYLTESCARWETRWPIGSAARVLAGARGGLSPRSCAHPRARFSVSNRPAGTLRGGDRRDLSKLEFYLAFAYWRLACILEGVYSRYAAGAMGDDGFDFSMYPDSIARMGAQARHLAARVHDKD